MAEFIPTFNAHLNINKKFPHSTMKNNKHREANGRATEKRVNRCIYERRSGRNGGTPATRLSLSMSSLLRRLFVVTTTADGPSLKRRARRAGAGERK